MTHQSNALWPAGVCSTEHGNNITSDDHGTAEAAQHVCRALQRNGFGGGRQHFPLYTWVSGRQNPPVLPPELQRSPEDLRQALEREFPPNATSWAQATDEVRDMSRWAREELGIGESSALNFGAITTPAEWNTKGIASIVGHFDAMNTRQRAAFLARASNFL